MLDVLRACERAIVADSQITSLITQYEGRPAFFDGIAPSDAVCPYIVVTNMEYPDDIGVDSLQYSVDIYDEGITTARAYTLKTLIEKAVVNMQDYKSVFRSGYSGGLPDTNPNTIHVHTEFTIRYGRTDLYVV